MTNRTKWLLGGLAGSIALWLAVNTKRSLSDADALAHMLIAETGFNRDKNEMTQIVFAAINRAKKYGVTPAATVIPPGTPTWNGGALYRDRFDDAPNNKRYADAKAFVQAVLSGKSPYKNNGYTSFVHPGGMPVPPCSGNRLETDTVSGKRCLPEWVLSGKVVGGAMFV
jgi:Flp pilus assembly protein TadG